MPAFRRRRFPSRFRRRSRARVEMQTFRECTRELLIPWNIVNTCANPLTFADYVTGMGDPSTNTEIGPALMRALRFRGGVGQCHYHLGIPQTDDDCPCQASILAVTSLVVLPLEKGSRIVPAYLPNMAISRNQLSVVTATKADTEENVLWWRSEQLDFGKSDCTDPASLQCWPNNDIACKDGDAWVQMIGTAIGMYGRTWGRGEFRVRVGRRLDDLHALFLVTHLITGDGSGDVYPDCGIRVQRQFYLRYAVSPSR